MTLYVTDEWQKEKCYYRYEYCLEDDQVVKYECKWRGVFWRNPVGNISVLESWALGDPDIPEWLHQYIEQAGYEKETSI